MGWYLYSSIILICFQGLVFDVVPSTFSEDLVKSDFKLPVEYAQETSKHKALDVATSLKDDLVMEYPALCVRQDHIELTLLMHTNFINACPADMDGVKAVIPSMREHPAGISVVAS